MITFREILAIWGLFFQLCKQFSSNSDWHRHCFLVLFGILFSLNGKSKDFDHLTGTQGQKYADASLFITQLNHKNEQLLQLFSFCFTLDFRTCLHGICLHLSKIFSEVRHQYFGDEARSLCSSFFHTKTQQTISLRGPLGHTLTRKRLPQNFCHKVGSTRHRIKHLCIQWDWDFLPLEPQKWKIRP